MATVKESHPVWAHPTPTGESEGAQRAYPGGIPEGGPIPGGRGTSASPGPEEGGRGYLREAAGEQNLPGLPKQLSGHAPVAAGGAEPAGAPQDAAGEARGC